LGLGLDQLDCAIQGHAWVPMMTAPAEVSASPAQN
jgi:hypothetical protein